MNYYLDKERPMKNTEIVVAIVVLLVLSLFLQQASIDNKPTLVGTPKVWVGVDVAYDNLTEMKQLVDKISPYTNLIVIGADGITYNVSKLDEACQYVYDRGLSFILFTEKPFDQQWLESAKTKWGDRFMGLNAFDEVGGRQLDVYKYRPVWQANNYSDASAQYTYVLNRSLNYVERNYTLGLSLFSSEYAFYWFDYKSGYDVLFAEFSSNYSRQLSIALCRGAATALNKNWGAIITRTTIDPPYLESGQDLYKDMVLAYNNGAKYILVFDTDKNYTNDILKPEHLAAMKQFWQYATNNPEPKDSSNYRIAYVIPKDYAYGFRGPNDKIWGLWEADNLSAPICISLNSMLRVYGTRLDIIYSDGIDTKNMWTYNHFIFWNGTVYDR
jgi:hypothetical protein